MTKFRIELERKGIEWKYARAGSGRVGELGSENSDLNSRVVSSLDLLVG